MPDLVEEARCGLRCSRVTSTGICDRCDRLAREDLRWLPIGTVELHARIAREQIQGGEGVSGTKERPLPIDPAKFDHKQVIYDVATGWARHHMEERHLAGPANWRLQTVVDWLDGWHDWATRQPWSDEYAGEIREAAHTARVMCSLYDEKPSYVPDLRCPQCRLADMWREPGEDAIICHSCQAVLRGDQMRAALAETIAMASQRTDMADVSGLAAQQAHG